MRYVPLGILFGVLFLLLTLFFYVDYLRVKFAFDGVYKEWKKLSPQMQELKALETRVEIEMRGEKEFFEKYVLNTTSIGRILQWISEYLPQGGWLTELKVEREGDGGKLVLQGVVLSVLAKTNIEQIEEYMGKLKEKLPRGSFSLTTAKQDEKKSGGTAFTATFNWGNAQT